jgi:hypothetical protein
MRKYMSVVVSLLAGIGLCWTAFGDCRYLNTGYGCPSLTPTTGDCTTDPQCRDHYTYTQSPTWNVGAPNGPCKNPSTISITVGFTQWSLQMNDCEGEGFCYYTYMPSSQNCDTTTCEDWGC